MPVYDYQCQRCGPFTETRPMAMCEAPCECPECGADAPRAFLTAPYFASMAADRRIAIATNERAASTPQTLSAMTRSHGSGCGCCSGKPLRRNKAKTGPGGTKSAGSRPWMISH